MANHEKRLSVPTRKQSPYIDVWQYPPVDGGDTVQFLPAKDIAGIPQIYKLINGVVYLSTSAVVANRNISLAHYRYGDVVLSYLTGAVAASGESYIYVLPVGMFDTGTFLSRPVFGLSSELVIDGENSNSVIASIVNAQVGDAFYAHLLFKYLNYELGVV